MDNVASNLERRTLLQLAAGLAVGSALGLAGGARAAAVPPAATGKSGDFDFLTGEWTIKHRQWKNKKWDLFTGEATVVGILGGIASIEELRIPERNFSGMGLRLLDVNRKLWADFWVNSQSGVLGSGPPGGASPTASVPGTATTSTAAGSPSSSAAVGTRSRPPPAAGIRPVRRTTARAGRRAG